MTPKLLVCIPSPRDIPEVKENWDKYDYDVLVAKYMQQKEAYTFLREYFLDHAKYTHFCLIPDDLVVKPEQLDELWSNALELDSVVNGICAVDEDESRPKGIPMAIQYAILESDGNHERNWVWKHDLPDDDIFQVEHAGFPCTIIPRRIMEKVSWRGASKINEWLEGNFDWQFSKECKKMGEPIFVCKNLEFPHLRIRQAKESKENPKNKESTHFMIFNESYYR